MNFITKKHIPRRTFLRGVGATVALPLLESMLPAATAMGQTAAASRSRYSFIHVPHGAIMPEWTPATEGRGFEISRILSPMAPFQDQMIVVSDTEHAMAAPLTPEESAGDHSRTSAVFLSGAHPKRTEGADVRAGITIDQLLASHIGQDTPLPSIELAIEDPGALGVCGFGYSCVYSNTISWSSATTPLPVERNPQLVFERLFGDGSTPAERLQRKQDDRSILDSVTRDVARLRLDLGATDQARLDRYLEDLREVERRIQISVNRDPVDAVRPETAELPFEEHIKLMFDMLALAYQAEITRISTLMVSRDASDNTYPNSGISDAYHALSHHQENSERMERYARLNAYHVGVVAYFLDMLRSIPDGDGTLLDHSMVLFGSPMSNSNTHDHGPLPVVMVGGGSGLYEGNHHYRNPQHTPMSNLFVTMANKEGIDIDSFGDDSTGRLEIY